MKPDRDPEENETQNLYSLVDFANLRVLEIGCGDGRLTRRFADLTREVAAVDSDPASLTEAVESSQAFAQVKYVQAQAEALPFQAEQFDLAILSWSL